MPAAKRSREARRVQVANLKGRLLDRQHELLTRIKTESRLPDKSTQHASDPADRALLDAGDELALQVVEMRLMEVVQIEEALHRISEGTYGLCEWCGKPIPPARLALLPEATLCVKCQKDFERVRPENEQSEAWERVGGASQEAPHREPRRSYAASRA